MYPSHLLLDLSPQELAELSQLELEELLKEEDKLAYEAELESIHGDYNWLAEEQLHWGTI